MFFETVTSFENRQESNKTNKLRIWDNTAQKRKTKISFCHFFSHFSHPTTIQIEAPSNFEILIYQNQCFSSLSANMGCNNSKSEEIKEQERANRLVETQLRRAKSEFLNEIKLLLLGTGESGKSTIAKQMKILHTNGFTKDELLTFKPIAIHNTVTAMKALVKGVEQMGLSFDEDNKVFFFVFSFLSFPSSI